MNSSIVSSISVENSIETLIEIPLNLSVQSPRRVQLCDPVYCSTPGFPVHHQLLELIESTDGHFNNVNEQGMSIYLYLQFLLSVFYSFHCTALSTALYYA